MITDGSYSISTRAIWTAYPILDAAFSASLHKRCESTAARVSSGVFLGFGAALWLVSDFTSLIFGDDPAIHKWLDLGWMLGAVGLAVSTRPMGNVATHP